MLSGLAAGGVPPRASSESYLALDIATGEFSTVGFDDMAVHDLIPRATSFVINANPDGMYGVHPSPSFTIPAGKGGVYMLEVNLNASDVGLPPAQASFFLYLNGDTGQALADFNLGKVTTDDTMPSPSRAVGLYTFADGDVIRPKFTTDTETSDAGFRFRLHRIISRGPRGVTGEQGEQGDTGAAGDLSNAAYISIAGPAAPLEIEGGGVTGYPTFDTELENEGAFFTLGEFGDVRTPPHIGRYLVDLYIGIPLDTGGAGLGPVIPFADAGLEQAQFTQASRPASSTPLVMRGVAHVNSDGAIAVGLTNWGASPVIIPAGGMLLRVTRIKSTAY